MTKRNKSVAKLHNELKSKETSLKLKLKNDVDEDTKNSLATRLYEIQYKLKRGAPDFN